LPSFLQHIWEVHPHILKIEQPSPSIPGRFIPGPPRVPNPQVHFIKCHSFAYTLKHISPHTLNQLWVTYNTMWCCPVTILYC
jgi:hypothetical protein